VSLKERALERSMPLLPRGHGTLTLAQRQVTVFTSHETIHRLKALDADNLLLSGRSHHQGQVPEDQLGGGYISDGLCVATFGLAISYAEGQAASEVTGVVVGQMSL
jgi:hypothetical protein